MPASKDFVSLKKKSSSNFLECSFCHKQWDVKGFGNHLRACERKHIEALQQIDHEKQMGQEASKSDPTRKFRFISAAEYISWYT